MPGNGGGTESEKGTYADVLSGKIINEGGKARGVFTGLGRSGEGRSRRCREMMLFCRYLTS